MNTDSPTELWHSITLNTSYATLQGRFKKSQQGSPTPTIPKPHERAMLSCCPDVPLFNILHVSSPRISSSLHYHKERRVHNMQMMPFGRPSSTPTPSSPCDYCGAPWFHEAESFSTANAEGCTSAHVGLKTLIAQTNTARKKRYWDLDRP